MKFTRGRKFRPIYRPITLLHSHGVVRSAALFALAGLLLGSSAQLSGAQSDSEKRPAQKAGASAKSKSKDKNAQANLPAVLVYPPDSKGSASAPLVDVVTEVEQSRLMTSGSYRGLLYQRSMPSIRRAVLDQTLSAEAVHPPFDDNAKVGSVRLEIGVINYCKLNLYNTYLQDDANIIYTYYAPQIRYFDILIRRSSLWLQNIHHAWDMLIDETEDPHQFRMEGLSISFLKPDELVEQALQNNLR